MVSIIPAHESIDLAITLTSPFHHGAGSSGNTSLLRTEEIVRPDGSQVSVPFLSANSVRHGLRDAIAWHAVKTLGIGDGELAKGVVDLLWSGGAVTTTGAQVNLDLARRIEELFPALAWLGYAAQSDIIAGTLRVSQFILVCEENAWRLPGHVANLPHAGKRAAAFRGEEFGTRHDVQGGPTDRFVDILGSITGTTQMIYDLQVLKPGAILHGTLSLAPGATDAHRMVLGAALALWAENGQVHVGAKNAVGYGEGKVSLPRDYTPELEAWTAHLLSKRDEIVPLWAEVAA